MKKSYPVLFFLLMLALSSMAQKGTGDTLTGKWNGKWDPTDPLCPCYDIQKQAEKEYQEMLKKEQKDSTRVEDKKQGNEIVQNPEKTFVKDNNTDQVQNTKIVKAKVRKKRNKGRERKYKKGKAVCPEV